MDCSQLMSGYEITSWPPPYLPVESILPSTPGNTLTISQPDLSDRPTWTPLGLFAHRSYTLSKHGVSLRIYTHLGAPALPKSTDAKFPSKSTHLVHSMDTAEVSSNQPVIAGVNTGPSSEISLVVNTRPPHTGTYVAPGINVLLRSRSFISQLPMSSKSL